MLKKLAGTGVNFGVLVISIVVFVLAFFLLNGMAAAQKPPMIKVLAASKDLQIGDVISASTLTEKNVYQDENTEAYINAEDLDGVMGGIVSLPFSKGDPIFQSAVLMPSGDGTRLAALLTRYPDGTLFPLQLDSQNIVSPEATSFLPGDLIGITAVISSRPQEKSTQEVIPPYGAETILYQQLTPVVPTVGPAATEESELDKMLDRGYPPLSKDIFPEGVRVISVQGLPQSIDEPESADVVTPDSNAHPTLILLVPREKVEVLSLSLQQGSQVFVSLLCKGKDEPSEGFSYWDFEEWFKDDRLENETRNMPAAAHTQQQQPTAAATVEPTATPVQ